MHGRGQFRGCEVRREGQVAGAVSRPRESGSDQDRDAARIPCPQGIEPGWWAEAEGRRFRQGAARGQTAARHQPDPDGTAAYARSEEHTSELQSLMRNSYAVFCLKKKKNNSYVNISMQ